VGEYPFAVEGTVEHGVIYSIASRIPPGLFGWLGGSSVLMFFGSLVGLFGLVGLVVWLGLFCFVLWKMMRRGSAFHMFLKFLVDFGSLEVTFSEILVSLGRLWTCLVPRGIQGADDVEIWLSRGSLLALFWGIFWSTTVTFLGCFLLVWFLISVSRFLAVWGVFLRGVWTISVVFFENMKS